MRPRRADAGLKNSASLHNNLSLTENTLIVRYKCRNRLRCQKKALSDSLPSEPFVLRLLGSAYPEAICNTVDIVEPRGDQIDLKDACVVEAVLTQSFDVPSGHLPGCFRQFRDVVEHGEVGRIQGSRPIVRADRVDERFIQTDTTQKLCVGLRSIEA